MTMRKIRVFRIHLIHIKSIPIGAPQLTTHAANIFTTDSW